MPQPSSPRSGGGVILVFFMGFLLLQSAELFQRTLSGLAREGRVAKSVRTFDLRDCPG